MEGNNNGVVYSWRVQLFPFPLNKNELGFPFHNEKGRKQTQRDLQGCRFVCPYAFPMCTSTVLRLFQKIIDSFLFGPPLFLGLSWAHFISSFIRLHFLIFFFAFLTFQFYFSIFSPSIFLQFNPQKKFEDSCQDLYDINVETPNYHILQWDSFFNQKEDYFCIPQNIAKKYEKVYGISI